MKSKSIHLRLSEELVKRIEERSKKLGIPTIQDYIRHLLIWHFEDQEVDELRARIKRLEDEVDKLKKFMSKYLERAVEIVNSNNKKTKLEF